MNDTFFLKNKNMQNAILSCILMIYKASVKIVILNSLLFTVALEENSRKPNLVPQMWGLWQGKGKGTARSREGKTRLQLREEEEPEATITGPIGICASQQPHLPQTAQALPSFPNEEYLMQVLRSRVTLVDIQAIVTAPD